MQFSDYTPELINFGDKTIFYNTFSISNGSSALFLTLLVGKGNISDNNQRVMIEIASLSKKYTYRICNSKLHISPAIPIT